jgi:superoxide dismutase, Fe-Mn family
VHTTVIALNLSASSGSWSWNILEAVVYSSNVLAAGQAKFSATAANHFGSGWAWLVKQGDKLEVVGTHDAGNPLKDGTGIPLLVVE